MMIQNAPEGQARFISMMSEHNELCGQFIQAFGNDRFEKPDPFEETVFVISNHDRGWERFDANPVLDPKSGFPTGVGGAKGPGGAATTQLSPDFNEERGPYCGLLASMHTWGLYNDRYGYSDFRVRQGGSLSVPISDEMMDETNEILVGEIERQEKLKRQLQENPATAPWIEEKALLRNYKLLQFCDTLALYFNLRHQSDREIEIFTHVPETIHKETSVTVSPLGENYYSFQPFPFFGNKLEVRCKGRYMAPISQEDVPDDLGAYISGLPLEEQVFIFVSKN